jgi:hypothetical protein
VLIGLRVRGLGSFHGKRPPARTAELDEIEARWRLDAANSDRYLIKMK